jgi:hypothetical protein
MSSNRLSRSGAPKALVGGGVHERGEFVRVVEADLDHPTGAVRVFVDQLGRGVEFVVQSGHFAGERGEQVGDGLDRFDRAEGVVAGDGRADGGQFDVDDVAEFVLGVRGDADGAFLAVNPDPFVFPGVAQLVGIHLIS